MSRDSMSALGYIFACLTVLLSGRVASAAWWVLDPPVSFNAAGGKPVKATSLTVDMKAANLQILSVPFELKSSLGSAEVSLRSFAEQISKQPRYGNKEWIAVNGGFSSYRVDVPLGLLVVNGKVYSPLAKEKPRAAYAASASEFSKLRWSGVLCQLKDDNSWDIIAATRYQPGLCQQALQAGPVPVEPNSKVAISAAEATQEKPYKRTILCLMKDTRVRAIVTQETQLFHLAQWLSKPESGGGLGCRVALNLSGDSSSAIAIRSPGDASIKFIGEGSFPIPTALLFGKK
jgi:uncharacterized protein YigE (DUF2233 family)